MSGKIVQLDDATFDEHVKASEVPVLVDFWAEWCGPCKVIAPILEEIAEEQGDKISIAKLNVDDSLDVTRRYDVMSIPTLLLFKDGEPEGPPGRGEAQGPAPPGDLRVPVDAEPTSSRSPRARRATPSPTCGSGSASSG